MEKHLSKCLQSLLLLLLQHLWQNQVNVKEDDTGNTRSGQNGQHRKWIVESLLILLLSINLASSTPQRSWMSGVDYPVRVLLSAWMLLCVKLVSWLIILTIICCFAWGKGYTEMGWLLFSQSISETVIQRRYKLAHELATAKGTHHNIKDFKWP